MLGYRSLFEVDVADREVSGEVLAQVYSWLRGKRYDADRLAVNEDAALLAPGVEAVITAEEARDGSASTLFALREESSANGTWITQIIVHEPGRGRPWVWIDIEREGVEEVWAARPNIARMILEVLPGDDEGALLTASPTLLDEEGVPALVDVLMNRERRGPVFVAGSSDELPIQRWSDYVGELLRETVGLSAGYVLDGDATARLVELVGERHAVEPGTLRTYLPGLDPQNELDSFRHRFLTTDAIVKSPAGRVKRTLGQRARDLALNTPVPRWATRVESRLLSATDARVIGWRPTTLVEQDEGEQTQVGARAPIAVEPASELAEEATAVVPEEQTDERASVAGTMHDVIRVTEETELSRLARELFAADLDAALLRRLADERAGSVTLAAERISLDGALSQANTRLRQLNARVLDLEQLLDEARDESEDAQLEWAQADSLASERARTIRTLRLRLMEAGLGEAAWAPAPAPTPREVAPETFADLLVRFGDFDHVTFTGDPEPGYVLDEKMPVGVAAKAWGALLALDDYGRGKKHGDVAGGVHQYLLETPVGYVGFSANRHAQTESEDVQNNPRFADARLLPVPIEIDPNGHIFMGAHFKIAQFGTISPRLHYYDATGADGRVYVGYLGPHLPTQRST